MSSEELFLEQLAQLMRKDACDDQVMSIIHEALREHSSSAALWRTKGEAHLLRKDHWQVALICYVAALSLDAESAETWEDVGYLLDDHTDDLQTAQMAFEKCISSGGTPLGMAGLARVLAQRGMASAALRACASSRFANEPVVVAMVEEIQDGLWESK